jgi:hypothetical protein
MGWEEGIKDKKAERAQIKEEKKKHRPSAST